MDAILIFGIVLTMGFVMGRLAEKIMLPRITGYIVAGIVLNPQIFPFFPKDIVSHTGLITKVALAFITFSIGGTLRYQSIKKLGKSIVSITLFEAEITFLIVFAGLVLTLPYCINIPGHSWLMTYIPLSLLIAAIASPTDPTASLAVAHQYKAKGDVTSTILGVGASDDALGLINYSIAMALTQVMLMHKHFNISTSFIKPLVIVMSSLVLGALFGFILNWIMNAIRRETEGVFAVIIFGLLSICFGTATYLHLDELLATMTMGIMVANFCDQHERVFGFLERYTEEMVFVMFFTISGMFLDFSVLSETAVVVALYTVFRLVGKFFGTFLGAQTSGASAPVKKYTAFGLIPSGGIIVGLALMLKAYSAYDQISGIIINTVIGATVIHELIGPLFVKIAMIKTGEIQKT